MRPYVITGIGTAIIISVVAGMWLVWGVNTVDFITALAVGIVLIIPFIWWWAYKNENGARSHSASTESYWQMLKKLKPKKAKAVQPTFSGIEVNPEKIDEDSKRRRETKWRFFPANYK